MTAIPALQLTGLRKSYQNGVEALKGIDLQVEAGDFYAPKTCEPCRDLRQWVANNLPCFCWAHGNLLDDAKEAVDEARHRAPLETPGLLFGFLRRLHAIERGRALATV